MNQKNAKKFIKGGAIACLIATIAGVGCMILKQEVRTTGRKDDVQYVDLENTDESQKDSKSTATDNNKEVKVENTQPQIESYNDSIETTNENVSAPKTETTTGSTTNKIVVEDNSKAVEAANEEIREAAENGAVIVEDKETGVTASSETQPQEETAEEEKETQKRVDLDFSQAVDAVNEK